MPKKRMLGDARFKFRSDTLTNWNSNNPILLSGEFGVVNGLYEVGDGLENPTEKVKIGDGVHNWDGLEWWKGSKGDKGDAYELTSEDIESIVNMAKPPIDLTFNADSENAQSGKAVAEAVNWIVLADQTLDETNGNVKVVNIELEKEKVNACREFMFRLEFKNDVELKDSYIQVALVTPYLHSVLAYISQQTSTFAAGKNLKFASFSIRDNECMYSIFRSLYTSVEYNSKQTSTNTTISYNYDENADVIKLRVAFQSEHTFPVGTHIRLVGRR